MNQDYFLEHLEYKDGDLFYKKTGKIVSNIEPIGYLRVCLHKKQYKAHRVIWMMHYGYMPEFLDHIDGNKTNNCIKNLRLATKQQNACNRKIGKTNKSGIKNVSWLKNRKKWHIQISANNKKHHWFTKDLELAELIAQEARRKFHGNFANYI